MTQPTTALLLPIPTWGFSHAVAELEPLDRAPAFVLSPSRRARYCHRPRHHAWRHLTWIDHDRYLVGCRCQLEP